MVVVRTIMEAEIAQSCLLDLLAAEEAKYVLAASYVFSDIQSTTHTCKALPVVHSNEGNWFTDLNRSLHDGGPVVGRAGAQRQSQQGVTKIEQGIYAHCVGP